MPRCALCICARANNPNLYARMEFLEYGAPGHCVLRTMCELSARAALYTSSTYSLPKRDKLMRDGATRRVYVVSEQCQRAFIYLFIYEFVCGIGARCRRVVCAFLYIEQCVNNNTDALYMYTIYMDACKLRAYVPHINNLERNETCEKTQHTFRIYYILYV